MPNFKPTRIDILDSVYKSPSNRYLAGFASFLDENRGHFMIENIIEDGFNDFFFHHIFKYSESWTLPIHFTGSIAYIFRDVLKDMCQSYELQLGRIIQTRWMDLFPIINNLPNGSSKVHRTSFRLPSPGSHGYHGGTSIHEPGRQAGGRCAGISTGTGSKPRGCGGRPFAGRRTAFISVPAQAAGWEFWMQSECPPTFGVEPGLVIGVIAGGPAALQQAVEFAEDDWQQGWKDLEKFHLSSSDFVIGISASGTTPYVCGALEQCRKQGIQTGCITCNPASPLSQLADFPVETVTGPEFITGSTRLKAGTAQKMALNMISTAVMIRLGRVEDNQMVHMQLSNEKLIDRV